jgi:hypothetical protein
MASPFEHQLGTDRASEPLGFHERHELGQEYLLGAHLESEGFAQAQIRHQLCV